MQHSILHFSQKYGIIYLSRGQGNSNCTKASTENGNKKFLKIFKKSLDKIPLMWYNKYVVKREKRKPSQSEFGNGNKKTLDK